MKPNKPKSRNKPQNLPEFCGVNMPLVYKLALARFGAKVGRRQDVIKLYDNITRWREQLPVHLEKLRRSGYSEAQLESFSANKEARASWCLYMEDAMVRADAEFFETLAALVKLKNEPSAHPNEERVWAVFIELLRANEKPSEDGKDTVANYPTKGQIRRAYEARRYAEIASWPRMWRRLKLDWLPEEKGGRAKVAKKRNVRGK